MLWSCTMADDRCVDETWMLDELAHAGPEHLDEKFISGYDRKQGYPDPAADIAAFEAHGLDGDSTVIDFAAGTGQFAVPAARRGDGLSAAQAHALAEKGGVGKIVLTP